MAFHNTLGKWGEQLAVDELTSEGFAIAETNWHMSHHEIDIIATRGNLMVVAEVKTRSDMTEDPLAAVDSRKINAMVRAARAYMDFNRIEMDVRFDLFAICGTPGGEYRMEHIPDAFYPPLKSYR